MKMRYNAPTQQIVYLTNFGWMYALSVENDGTISKKGPRLLVQGLRRPSASPDILFIEDNRGGVAYHMARVSFLEFTRYNRADVRLERIWR
jgi:hypothetical protein